MNSGKLHDWLQVAGLFAVFGSLVFVGMQMQQEQRIALSQAYQARADQSIAITLAALESETALSFWAKSHGFDHEEYSPTERAFGIQTATAWLSHWENNHYQYQEGFISEEHWQTQLEVMRFTIHLPLFRSAFDRDRNIWRASFRKIVEDILKEPPLAEPEVLQLREGSP